MDTVISTLDIFNTSKNMNEFTEEIANILYDVVENVSQDSMQSNTSRALERFSKPNKSVIYVEKNRQIFEINQHKPEDQHEYFVDTILGTRKRKGIKEFKIRWCGFDSDWDTWEPQTNLSIALIRAYENKRSGGKTYRVTGASETVSLNSLTPSKPIFQLDGKFNRVLDSYLKYYETNKWFIPEYGFESDETAGLLACEVEMRFWANVCMEWEKLESSIKICPILMGENWTSLKEKRETCKKMRQYSNYRFGTRLTVKVKFSSLLQTGKPVLSLVFAPKERNGNWDFIHVLSVLVVGKEVVNRKVYLYNPLIREEAERNGLINNRVRQLRNDICVSYPIQLGFGGQVDTCDCYIWALRFISNVGDGYDYVNEIEWSDYNPY